MNLFIISITTFLIFISNDIFAQREDLLEKYHWKNRILIIFSPSQSDKIYNEQIVSLTKARAGIQERDIIIFKVLSNEGVTPENQLLTENICQKLREEFGVKEQNFCIVLIGKDGGEKYRTATSLSTDALFAIIDAMPMRKTEIRQKKYDD
jgi:hypothetical protein